MHREKAQQNEMNQRNEQTLAQRAEFLAGHAAGQGGAAALHERGHPCERIWREPHVGINEHEQRMPRKSGQDETSVLFAAPPGGQRGRGFEANAIISPCEFGDNRGGAVGGMIVQHDDFKVAAMVGEHGLKRGANVLLLVARGDEHADRIGDWRFAIRNRTIDEQVQQKQTRRKASQNQRNKGKKVQIHLRPCSRLNGFPRSLAVSMRHQS